MRRRRMQAVKDKALNICITRERKCNWKFRKLLKRSYSAAATAATANAAAVDAATAWRCCSPTKYTNFCSYTRSPRHTR